VIIVISFVIPAAKAMQKAVAQIGQDAQMANIHKAMLEYGEDNATWLPGMDSSGKVIEPSAAWAIQDPPG